jgi:predicted GNAT family acetyltransferase
MEVIHDLERQKFYVVVNKMECYLKYVMAGKVMNLAHTFVPIELRGRGIAAEIVKAALTYAKKNNLKVMPLCSYVADYIQRHKEYEILVYV